MVLNLTHMLSVVSISCCVEDSEQSSQHDRSPFQPPQGTAIFASSSASYHLLIKHTHIIFVIHCALQLLGRFNYQIDSMTWPDGLVKLTFGERFNRPIERTTWPDKLQVLTFGDQFNQPVEGMTWPLCLRKVIFGNAFNHPIRRAAWSATTIRFVLAQGIEERRDVTSTCLLQLLKTSSVLLTLHALSDVILCDAVCTADFCRDGIAKAFVGTSGFAVPA